MSKPKMKRWVCPRCGGGVLAPERPRKHDARRYCLTCTATSGRLVERICPALDAVRARRASGRQAVAARRRAREQALLGERHMVEGLDLRDELSRLCRLPFVRRHFPVPRWSPVKMTVAWSSTKRWTTGHSKRHGWHVHLGLYEGCPRHEAQALLAHELAHAILPGKAHGERWRRAFARIVADGYGIEWIPARAMEGSVHDLQATVEHALRIRNSSQAVTLREHAAAKRRGS